VAVLVRAGASRLLVPGDVEQTGALALVEAGDVAAQALVVAHHGSRSVPRGAAGRGAPRIAIVSAGRDNVHGHPHPEIVRRIRRAGIALRRTDRDGACAWCSPRPGGQKGREEGEEEDGGQAAKTARRTPPTPPVSSARRGCRSRMSTRTIVQRT
jgi:competence protein ComEC